jgi:hypothetical protein
MLRHADGRQWILYQMQVPVSKLRAVTCIDVLFPISNRLCAGQPSSRWPPGRETANLGGKLMSNNDLS